MALVLCKNVLKTSQFSLVSLSRNSAGFFNSCVLNKSYSKSTFEKTEENSPVTKSVFISQSSDVFTNLALEDWLYKNFDFTNHHVLLLWRNSPCVVIGRHQNPWLEANTANLSYQGVELARRNSGGGTVYHDRGNLNLTFFTPRNRYNRRNNLEIISRALYREWGIETSISPREDVIVEENYKQISGTASKLGRPNAYHHCTLLVDVNKISLRQSLLKQDMGISTNATKSVPAPIINLCEINRQVKIGKLLSAIGWEYLRTCPITFEDGGKEQISKQCGFQMINPTESWFPGLEKIKEEFSSWDWCYGKTPKFEVTRSFPVCPETTGESSKELKITLFVEKGIIQNVTLTVPPGIKSANGFHGEARVVTSLRGRRFSEEAVFILENSLQAMKFHENDLVHTVAVGKNDFLGNHRQQAMNSM